MSRNVTLIYAIVILWNTIKVFQWEAAMFPFCLEESMKGITNLMIKEYNLKKLGYDFMGFTFKRTSDLSFHHMIVPHKDCKRLHIESEGYVKWNGAILVRDTSHEYLHLIETIERARFNEITRIMVEMNKAGELDPDSIYQIEMLLREFEEEHREDTNKKGNKLIKDNYYNRTYR